MALPMRYRDIVRGLKEWIRLVEFTLMDKIPLLVRSGVARARARVRCVGGCVCVCVEVAVAGVCASTLARRSEAHNCCPPGAC